MAIRSLVTGGSGYFGEVLSRNLLARGDRVRIFDLSPPDFEHPNLEFVRGDVRSPDAVALACRDVDCVIHAVAQVPLAKEKHLFWSVNRDGTRVAAEEARKAGVRKFVYVSSSAIFGVPRELPVTEETPPSPAEDYGRAKLAGEEICREIGTRGLDVSIVRPRTILGHGRLGVVQILFDWIDRGLDVPVFDGGHNRYQFVHADDLADACIAAARRPGPETYNIGAKDFGSMRELLQAVIDHAGSRSRIKSVPLRAAAAAADLMCALRLSPLGPYHSLMYGRSMWFDVSKAERELGFTPAHGNNGMIIESFDRYRAGKTQLGAEGRSHHKSPVKQRVLAAVPHLLRWAPA